MIDFVQRASSRSAGFLSLIAQSLGFAGPVVPPVRGWDFGGVLRREPAIESDALSRQASGDWYERLV